MFVPVRMEKLWQQFLSVRAEKSKNLKLLLRFLEAEKHCSLPLKEKEVLTLFPLL